jgi:3-deoxy-D-manno-octulosonic-acid transferase
MSNFKVIAGDLLARGAAATVSGPEELDSHLASLVGDSGRRQAMAAAATSWRNQNGGAVERTLEAIRGELSGAA